MKRFLLLLIGLVLCYLGLSAETASGIYYNDGTFRAGKPKLHSPLFGEKYLSMGDTTRIVLHNVKLFANDTGVFLKVEGIYGKPDVATRFVEGRISAYRNYQNSMQYNGGTAMNGMPGGGWTHSSKEVLYCTAGPDSVFLLNYANLNPILSNDPRCAKPLKSYRTSREIMYWSIGIGVASAIAGAASLNKDNNRSTGSVIFFSITGVCGLTAFINSQAGKYHLFKSIDAYNK